ncbi:uncharacterized protein CTHT_0062210 [Thermochaetoides thermophila DSM 1495]|uniref:CSI2 protein n=1 Tax=Chaetomium thermophilum (strain DSM 1495 / CBS 144.50 / IMI 039719) TaxID=759272 RepID=G0SE29_CHATD|nr:hypothetical protein CTHT_0062210 [Thermochaetoides thermophila DSM 1495]EGS18206.1 hypothetical protein CTHT_0062210 [Thermochaetoides thermophila DSM 1495]
MTSPPLSLKRALLLSAFFALRVLAQDDDGKSQTSVAAAPTTSQRQNNPPQATTSANNDNNNNPPTTTIVQPPPVRTTTTPAPPAQTSETKDEPETSTTSERLNLPALTTSTSSTTYSRLTDMPTLSRTVNTEIPTYPPPTIPPTKNAPFMNHSTLPDGTVFIAVGAILGGFGLAVLAWRAMVAFMLRRSIKEAARAQYAANNGHGKGMDKNAASFPAPPAQFYKYLERESSHSLAGGPGAGSSSNGAGIGVRRTNRGATPSATPSQTNLFFSPTAAGSSAAGVTANRDSRFLPSGFYASPASPIANQFGSAGGGGGGHHSGNSISMSTLRPSSRGRAGVSAVSPPDSPDVGPRVVSRNYSTSSLNLNRPPSPGGRAPSAYLDDLLDEQPGMFPPAGGVAGPSSAGQRPGGGSQRSRY